MQWQLPDHPRAPGLVMPQTSRELSELASSLGAAVRPVGSDDVTGIRMSASNGTAGLLAQSGQSIAGRDVSRDLRGC